MDLIDPPGAASEREMLLAFLDYQRAVVRRKAEGLDREALERTLGASSMTLGGMLRHLEYVEDHWLRERLLGLEPSSPWDAAPWADDPDWDWHDAKGRAPEELLAGFDAAVRRSRAIMADVDDLDAPLARPGAPGLTVRWLLVHLIEEHARHAGHADLIREAIDGVTGD